MDCLSSPCIKYKKYIALEELTINPLGRGKIGGRKSEGQGGRRWKGMG